MSDTNPTSDNPSGDVTLSHQTLQQSPKVVLVRIAGQGNSQTGRQIETYFDQMLEREKPRHVLLDLSELAFAASVFFGSLLFWRETMASEGGKLVLFALRPEVASTLRIATLDRVLTIRPDCQAALSALTN